MNNYDSVIADYVCSSCLAGRISIPLFKAVQLLRQGTMIVWRSSVCDEQDNTRIAATTPLETVKRKASAVIKANL